MGMDEEAAEISRGGGAFVLTWFTSLFYGDSATASTTNRVLEEVRVVACGRLLNVCPMLCSIDVVQ